MTWLPWAGWFLCALAVAVALLFFYGGWRWAVETRRLLGKLEAGQMTKKQGGEAPKTFNVRELAGLPTPVQRYFRAVLKDGQPIIASATLELAGTFNMSPTGERWKPFTSTQHVVTARPGFLWDARIAMLPGLPVRVIDSYITGEGLLHAALWSLFELAHVHGRGEIARGELMRFFAEMPWYPTALLPSQGVRWEAVDHRSAHATFADGRLMLKLTFKFDDAGLIESFRASARGSMMNKKMVMAPWEGQWSNYQVRDGMTVPMTGEVAWVRPEGRKSYFQGTVMLLKYTWVR